ncbi:MAG: SDR family oxidoreductase [Ignavibacteriales bacterium]|nr:SDR family oxidoreductase [Ignavibacteriales bacterium]
MSQTKYLVTGGAGFIGSNIVEELLKRGHSVRVLDNFSTGRRENIKEFMKDIELFEGDIRSYHTVNQAVKGVEVILHEAALPSVPRSINDPITSNEVNVGGTINILDAARDNGVRRVVFASSSSVYGDNPELPKHEGMLPNPLSPYAVSKLAGENYCRVYSRLYQIETLVLRYFNVFGPRQDPNSQYSAVIPKFIMAMKSDKQPVIFGDGTQSRDFTYVANVVEANILAAESNLNSGAVMNCATHGEVTLNELIDKINNAIGKNIMPIYADRRAGDIKHSYASIQEIYQKLNFKPVINFDTGLFKTIRKLN